MLKYTIIAVSAFTIAMFSLTACTSTEFVEVPVPQTVEVERTVEVTREIAVPVVETVEVTREVEIPIVETVEVEKIVEVEVTREVEYLLTIEVTRVVEVEVPAEDAADTDLDVDGFVREAKTYFQDVRDYDLATDLFLVNLGTYMSIVSSLDYMPLGAVQRAGENMANAVELLFELRVPQGFSELHASFEHLGNRVIDLVKQADGGRFDFVRDEVDAVQSALNDVSAKVSER